MPSGDTVTGVGVVGVGVVMLLIRPDGRHRSVLYIQCILVEERTVVTASPEDS